MYTINGVCGGEGRQMGAIILSSTFFFFFGGGAVNFGKQYSGDRISAISYTFKKKEFPLHILLDEPIESTSYDRNRFFRNDFLAYVG